VTTIQAPISLQSAPDQRGRPVDDFVARLSNPMPGQANGAMITLLECLVSFGLIPLLLWPTRWADYLETERHDLLDLAAWWHQRVDAANAAKLERIARRFRPRPLLMVLPWLAAGFNLVLMATLLVMGDRLGRIWDLTFGHDALRLSRAISSGTPLGMLESHLYGAWIGTLAVAYFCQWHAVRSHLRAVGSLVNFTNALARENRFTQIPAVTTQAGLNVLWIMVAVALCVYHAWWVIPMVFAGAIQRSYTRKISPTVRRALASQARSGFAVTRSRRDRFCAADHCGVRLPAPAKFCPRCGTAV